MYVLCVKALPKLIYKKNTALRGCLKTNTALGFTSCCICLFKQLLYAVFFMQTHDGA